MGSFQHWVFLGQNINNQVNLKVEKISKTLLYVLLTIISFNGRAELFPDSPAVTYISPIEKTPGSRSEVRIDTSLADITFQPGKYGNEPYIALYFYWCTTAGTGCTGPEGATVPEINIIARATLCSDTSTSAATVKCLHSQITPGIYTAEVPDIVYTSPLHSRGKVCLRYLYKIGGGYIFASNANSCRLSPQTNDWCSMVTPSINFNFGVMATSKAQGVMLEKDISVYCSAPVSYTISLAGQADSSMVLDNGMSVEFSLDGNELNQNLSSSSEGVINHKLKATLKGTPTSTGIFNATGVLFVDYP